MCFLMDVTLAINIIIIYKLVGVGKREIKKESPILSNCMAFYSFDIQRIPFRLNIV